MIEIIKELCKISPLKYKGFEGSARLCLKGKLLQGEIMAITDLVVSYQAITISELHKEFERAVDYYIELHKELKSRSGRVLN